MAIENWSAVRFTVFLVALCAALAAMTWGRHYVQVRQHRNTERRMQLFGPHPRDRQYIWGPSDSPIARDFDTVFRADLWLFASARAIQVAACLVLVGGIVVTWRWFDPTSLR
jgi:hypothetical protein